MAYYDFVNYKRDWTFKSAFQTDLVRVTSPKIIYDEIDKVDDIIIQIYPNFNKLIFPQISNSQKDIIRQLVFIEGIDFLYRSLNFVIAIQKLLLEGFYTAAQSMSYQASFFSARSILGLSGIYSSSIGSKNFFIDTYYNDEDSLGDLTEIYRISNIPRNHQTIWNLLDKIIELTEVDEKILNPNIFQILKNINYIQCTDLRHSIHYYNKYSFKDLFNPIEYSIKDIDNISFNNINRSCAYFDMLMILLIFAINLFASIAEYSPGLEDFIIKLKNLLNTNSNSILYQNSFYNQIKVSI